jgi:hypothetical protein
MPQSHRTFANEMERHNGAVRSKGLAAPRPKQDKRM